MTNGVLYFSAYTTKTGFQFWQSNGTAAGTTMDTSSGGTAGMSPTNLMDAPWPCISPVPARRCGNGQLEPSLHRWIRGMNESRRRVGLHPLQAAPGVGCHLAGRSSAPAGFVKLRIPR